MPVKILLADKSITIQKVVEMLFSGKDYEVVCVSDGETALSEAARVAPDVVLADIDLPRIDGYAFSGRLKQVPALAGTPVILMLSRDDVFDQAKARHMSIVDHIAKPFESQELIGKVKKAVSGGARPVEAAAASATAVQPQPPAAPPKPAKKAAAPDIFDIIDEAPTQEDIKRPAVKAEDEGVYEVEPVIEYEEQLPRETAKALPVGKKAVEEMREGLGLSGLEQTIDDEIVSFESLDMATAEAREYVLPQQQEKPSQPSRKPAPAAPAAFIQQPVISESDIWNMAEATVSKIAKEMLGTMQPQASAGMTAPQVSEEMLQASVQQAVRDMAREIIEKVAWEVVPDLAAAMIRAEIERLKAEP
jgi:CheY-like chemotaxis protein